MQETQAHDYRKLDLGNIIDYVTNTDPEISKILGGDSKDWKVSEIGDGNLNFIYRVEGQNGSVILKQAVPYIRMIESWPLTRHRARYENAALKEQQKCAPGFVPKVYHYDDANSVLIMEYIHPHIILRKGLIKGITYPKLSEDISEFLANTLFRTSGLALKTEERKTKVAMFSGNHELSAVTEKVVFTEPYMKSPNNRWTSPQLDSDAKSIRQDPSLKIAISDLKSLFQQSTECLIHGDFHTGSIMCTEDSTIVIDPEFACYGPMSFDLGAIIANLFLSYYSQDGHSTEEHSRVQYKEWILTVIEEVWSKFSKKFLQLWTTEHTGDMYAPSFFTGTEGRGALQMVQKHYMKNLFHDSLGFAGAKIIRRIVGVAHVEDFESISDPDIRAKCERKALKLGRELILSRKEYDTIQHVTRLAKQLQ